MKVTTEKKIFDTLLTAGLPLSLALLVVAQSKHETSVAGVPYSSRQFLTNKNCFGYGHVANNPLQFSAGGKHPEDTGVYAKYLTIENSVRDVAGWYRRRSATFFKITDAAKFVVALKSAGYFTDSYAHYLAGVQYYYSPSII